jgi:hypothetical protein
MANDLGAIRFVVWIGVILFFLWFLTFSLAPEGILTSLGLPETQGFFLRMYGIFPLSWAILFLFALGDIKKNIVVVNCAIITGALVIISILAYQFTKTTTGWFHLVSAAVIFLYSFLLFVFKPKVVE